MMEKANAVDSCGATLIKCTGVTEQARAHGRYHVKCFRDGQLLWEDVIENVVTTVGKNLALDTYLSGVAYTVNGPYMGLISDISFTGVNAGDTMALHAGWLEAGGANAPVYSGGRKVAVFSPAAGGSKTLSAVLGFNFTGAGTVKGCFLLFGAGATSTIDNTGGTLYSAGLFTSGDKVVASSDRLEVTYTAGL